MIKKLGIIGAIMLLVVSMIPLAFAEETPVPTLYNENSEVNDDVEAQTMTTPLGAQVRLLQLEKAVTKSILHMDDVIAVVGTNNTELVALQTQMKDLLTQIKGVTLTDTKEVLAQKYVEMKSSARNITANFRELTRTTLTETQKEQLRTEMKNKDDNRAELKDLKERVKQTIRQHNSEKAKKMLEKMKIKNEKLLDDIKEGKISPSETKVKLAGHFKGLNNEQKKESILQMKEERMKNKLEIKAAKDQKKEERQNKVEERKAEVEKKREEIRNNIAERRQQRNITNDVEDDVEDNIEEPEETTDDTNNDETETTLNVA